MLNQSPSSASCEQHTWCVSLFLLTVRALSVLLKYKLTPLTYSISAAFCVSLHRGYKILQVEHEPQAPKTWKCYCECGKLVLESSNMTHSNARYLSFTWDLLKIYYFEIQ